MDLSDGDKLILLMLCEIQEHLKVKGETDPSFIKEAIFTGNLWGLEHRMTGVFHRYETPQSVVTETRSILAMWRRLEESYNALSPEAKAALLGRLKPFDFDVRFPGFDGNTESEYISAASFMVDQLGEFEIFKGRDLNAHMPTLDAHRRMVAVFYPILKVVLNRDFDVDQLTQVLTERVHPTRRTE